MYCDDSQDPSSPYCNDQSFYDDLNCYLLDVDHRVDETIGELDDIANLANHRVRIMDMIDGDGTNFGGPIAALYNTNGHTGTGSEESALWRD